MTPGSWETVSLGELCEIALGKTPGRKTAAYWDTEKKTDNVWLSIADIPEALGSCPILLESKEHVSDAGAALCKPVKAGTLMVSFKLTLGRMAIAGKDLLTNEAIAALTIKDEDQLDRDYLYWYFTYFDWQDAAKNDHKIKGKTLNKSKLKLLPVILPPLSEQRRIVSVLDAAFAGLATATAHTQKNLQNDRELFERELESIYQRVNARADIPKRQLSELMKIGSSKRIMETDWTPDGVPFYGGKEIVELAKNGTTTSRNYISEEKYDEYAQQYDMPSPGDILFTARGTIGTGYIVQKGDKFYYKDGNIISMRPKGEINSTFVLYAFATNVIKHQLEGLSGTTVKHLPLNKAKKLLLPVPSIKEQAALVENIKNLQAAGDSLTDLVNRKLAALSELKQSLLHRAFCGELSGGEADEQLSISCEAL